MSGEDRRATHNSGWVPDGDGEATGDNGARDSREWDVTPEMSGQPGERPEPPPVTAQVRGAGGSGHRSHARRPHATDTTGVTGVPNAPSLSGHNGASTPNGTPMSSGGDDGGIPKSVLRIIRWIKVILTLVFMVALMPMVMIAFDQLQAGPISGALGSILVIAGLCIAFGVAIMSIPSRP